MYWQDVLPKLGVNRSGSIGPQYNEQKAAFGNIFFDAMSKAERFHLGEYVGRSTPLVKKEKRETMIEELMDSSHHMPFDFLWIDGRLDYKRFGDGYLSIPDWMLDITKMGTLCFKSGNGMRIITCAYLKSRGGWVVEPIILVLEDGNVLIDAVGELTRKPSEGALWTLYTFLSLLSCKNVVTRTIHPPAKVNKKRLRHGRKPQIVSYRVLCVQMPGKPGIGKKTGITQRLHMCRGHFKTYTADKPLFGKLTGTFWIQPHIRGINNKKEN